MNIKDLKVGDKVFIREDLEDGFTYGNKVFTDGMDKGLLEVSFVSIGNTIIQVHGNPFCDYTPEMIDWGKTIALENVKKNNLKGDDIIKNNPVHPSHYDGGKHGIECYKAIEYILDKLVNVPEKYYGHVFNVIKYIWRCNDKNGYEDLDKARVYLDFMFEEE